MGEYLVAGEYEVFELVAVVPFDSNNILEWRHQVADFRDFFHVNVKVQVSVEML